MTRARTIARRRSVWADLARESGEASRATTANAKEASA